jgi:catechol 2,3-dioxygenase-like lactoylglutathione lyase family enzyme
MSLRGPRRPTGMTASTNTRIKKIGRVIVPVSDQDRALEFYCETLGCEKTFDEPYGDGHRWVEVTPPGGETGIGLAPPMGGSTGVMTGVSFDVDDAKAFHEELRAAGVDVDEYMPAGQGAPSMFFFRDRDGNTLHAVGAA